jgi:hypothetical protein
MEQQIENSEEKETSETDGLTGEFYQIIKDRSILHKRFQKIGEEHIVPNSFYKTNITL